MPPLQAPLTTAYVPHTVPPFARLPNEILHQIFNLLETSQVANLRLACKAFSAIGLQYLASTIHLIFKPSSFEHLRQISEHPDLSQHVHTLFYEADSLEAVFSMKEWKRKIIAPDRSNAVHSEPMPAPPPNASTREQRAYRRHVEKLRAAPRYIYSAGQLRSAYEEYEHYVWLQNYIRQYDYNSDMIREAMAKLPKLKTIELSLVHRLLGGPSRKLEQAFAKGLTVACGDQGHGPCGVEQLQSLLVGASDAGLEIETLRCGSVQWMLFMERDVVFNKLKHAVRCLRTLELYITTRYDHQDHDWLPDEEVDVHDEEVYICAQYLEDSGRLRDFLTSAPQLENLTVLFDTGTTLHSAARLSDLVGDFSWHSLRLAAFSKISTTEEELMDFYERHAKTLREIRIESVHLDDGSWTDIFRRIHNTLSLEKATICGNLTAEDQPGPLHLGPLPKNTSCGDLLSLRAVIEACLVSTEPVIVQRH